jgi:hypothetical protein
MAVLERPDKPPLMDRQALLAELDLAGFHLV